MRAGTEFRPPPTSGRRERDRELFDREAAGLCRKDLVPASRRARRLRLEQTLRTVPLGSRSRVIELGCGAGFAAAYLGGRYGRYVGVDHSAVLITEARARHVDSNVTFVAGSLEEFVTDERFDVAFMIGVLHHLERPAETLAGIARLVVPGGYVAVNEPQSANPLIGLARRLRQRLDRSYSDEQAPLGKARLRALFDSAGLQEVRVVPQGLFSTPFAEVPIRPDFIAAPLCGLACLADRALEAFLGATARPLSWNLVVTARTPGRPENS